MIKNVLNILEKTLFVNIVLFEILQESSKMNLNILAIFVSILFCCRATSSDSKNSSDLGYFGDFGDYDLYCLGGRNENHDMLFSVSKMNIASRRWKHVREMPIPLDNFATAVYGHDIYVFGGFTDGGKHKTKRFEVFRTRSNTWDSLRSAENVRAELGIAVLHGDIYSAGGHDDNKRHSSVFRYDTRKDRWNEVKPLNEARWGHELVALNGVIYAIGGNGIRTVERYSPFSDKWTFVAPTINQHSYFGATAHQNKIYIYSENGFEMFDPHSNIWKSLPALSVGKGTQLVSIGDKLWAIGGGEVSNKDKASKSLYQFDTTNNSWTILPDIDVARIWHRAVVVNS